MKKRTIALVLAMIFSLGLTACGSDDLSADNKNTVTDHEKEINSEKDEVLTTGNEESGEGKETESSQEILSGKTEWYQTVESSARAWEIEITYKQKWTEVTIKHSNTEYIASYDAGNKPSGTPNKLSVYDLGGSWDPQKGSGKVELMLDWEGDILCLYLNDLDGFTPTDEKPWRINCMKFEKYDEA